VVKLAKIEKLVLKNIQDVINNLENVENGWLKKQNIQFVNSKNVANIIKVVLMENVKLKKGECKGRKRCKKIIVSFKSKCGTKMIRTKFTKCAIKRCCRYVKRCIGKSCKTKKLKCGSKRKCEKAKVKYFNKCGTKMIKKKLLRCKVKRCCKMMKRCLGKKCETKQVKCGKKKTCKRVKVSKFKKMWKITCC